MKLYTTYQHEGKELFVVVIWDRCLKTVEEVVRIKEMKGSKLIPVQLTEEEENEIVNSIEWMEIFRNAFNKAA
jgi:hypothetical protein